MKSRVIYLSIFLVVLIFLVFEPNDAIAQKGTLDPLSQVTSSFPGAIHLDERQRLLEFCPDNTCDGFVTTAQMSTSALKDFAYLYIYFFSDYYILQNWRKTEGTLKAAQQVLSKPEYQKCTSKDLREEARCVLMDLSSNGKIRLLSVGYDENRRNVTRRNIARVLSGPNVTPKQ